MTTGTNPEAHGPMLQRWATEQLGLEAGASPGQARSVLLDRLRNEDFVPPLRWQQAYRLFAPKKPSASPPEQVLDDAETQLRSEIAAFAANFFQLDLAERQRRCRELREQYASFPPLAARLRALQAGLNVKAEIKPEDRYCRQLAEHLRDLFVLPPAARAMRRQCLLQEMSNEIDSYKAAAQQLEREQPALVELEPHLIEQLLNWRPPLHQRIHIRLERHPIFSPGDKPAPSDRAASIIGIAVIAFVLGLIRIFSGGPGPSRQPSIPTWSYNMPKFEPVQGQQSEELRRIFEALQKPKIDNPLFRDPIEELIKREEKAMGRHSGIGAGCVVLMGSVSSPGPLLGVTALIAGGFIGEAPQFQPEERPKLP